MHDARTGRHLLNLIRPQHLHVAHAVLVGKLALQHIAQNLHIAVRVRSKSTPLRHTVFIDHTQRTISHVLRIMIVGKRKRMVRIQPSMVGVASLVTLANSQHNASSLTASPAHYLGPSVLHGNSRQAVLHFSVGTATLAASPTFFKPSYIVRRSSSETPAIRNSRSFSCRA